VPTSDNTVIDQLQRYAEGLDRLATASSGASEALAAPVPNGGRGRHRMVLVAAAVLVVAGIVGAAVLLASDSDSDQVRTTASTTTTTTVFVSPGPVPRELYGSWTVTSFDDGSGAPEPITWDPRRPQPVTFLNWLTPQDPGRMSFTDVWCDSGPTQVQLPLRPEGDRLVVDQAAAVEIGQCQHPGPPSALRQLLLTPGADLRYSIRDKVLRITDRGSGQAITAEREEDINAPLPADLLTPAVLYGDWVAVSWGDATGTHELQPPAGQVPSIGFGESSLGAYVTFSADCNASTGPVDHYTEDRIVLKEGNSFGSTLVLCSPNWSFPQVRELLTSGGVHWKVSGSTLTLSDEEGLTIRAHRVGRTYRSAK
jgi:hypothetical protein